MNYAMRISACILLFLLFNNTSSIGQEDLDFDWRSEIHRSFSIPSISKQKCDQAQNLLDLNKRYEAHWVKEYVSVAMHTISKGNKITTLAQNDQLTEAQKKAMAEADPGTPISFDVKYYPDNNLSSNDVKELSFSFDVDPDKLAEFPGGQEALDQYLMQTTQDPLEKTDFRKHHFTAVKFAIDRKGKVYNAHIFESSKNDKVDEVLLCAIKNMPQWSPAKYDSGITVNQHYVLAVGDMKSCVINLVGIDLDTDIDAFLNEN